MGLVYLPSTYMWLMFYGKHRNILYHTWILWARGICHNQDQQNLKVSNLQQLVVEMEVLNLPSGWTSMHKHGQQMSRNLFQKHGCGEFQ